MYVMMVSSHLVRFVSQGVYVKSCICFGVYCLNSGVGKSCRKSSWCLWCLSNINNVSG